MENTMFTAIEKTVLYEQIANDIEELILSDQLSQNERLPGETELSQRYEVSRNIIREALKILRERGLINIRSGETAIVTKPGPTDLVSVITRILKLDDIKIEHIYEVRRILEQDACRLAIHYNNDHIVKKLSELSKQMEIENSYTQWCNIDVFFHREIVKASRNPLYLTFYDAMQGALKAIIIQAHHALHARVRGEEHHQQILEAFRMQKLNEAAKLLGMHLDASLEDIKTVTEADKTSI